MYNPSRTTNAFTGNDFSGADLRGCEFDGGISIDQQRWPDDPDYVILDRLAERIEATRRAVARWPDDAIREHALGLLAIMSRGTHEQDEKIFRRSEWDSAPLYALLEQGVTT